MMRNRVWEMLLGPRPGLRAAVQWVAITGPVIVLSFLADGRGLAQVSSSAIAGNVTDASGAAVVGALVKARETTTGLERSTLSTDTSEYVLPQLPPGRYEMQVTASGFQAAVATDVVPGIAQGVRINFELSVGVVSEKVTVSAGGAGLLEPDTASLGQLIERRTIEDLPLNGTNYLTLAALAPG